MSETSTAKAARDSTATKSRANAQPFMIDSTITRHRRLHEVCVHLFFLFDDNANALQPMLASDCLDDVGTGSGSFRNN